MVIALAVIIKKQTGISLAKEDLKPNAGMMGQILKIGIPVALQDGFIQIAFIVITIIANRRGLNDAATVGIVEKIIGVVFLVPSTMLSTVSALSAQNIGAKKKSVHRQHFRYAICITVGFGIIVSIIAQFTGRDIVGMFSDNGAVIRLGDQYLRSYIWDTILAGIYFCFSGYFCAYGLSGISFLHNCIYACSGSISCIPLFPGYPVSDGLGSPGRLHVLFMILKKKQKI